MAEANGYDNFSETHCDLASAVHKRMRKPNFFKYYHVPCSYKVGEKQFYSEYEAKKTVKQTVKDGSTT